MLWIQWLSLPAPEAPPRGAFFVSRSTGGTDRARAQYILQANVAGTNLVQLTHEAGDNFSPTWSPDSQRLAFATNRDGFYQIYVMQVDGSEVQRLTDTNAREEKPAWSPHQFETSRPLLCPVTQPSGSRPPGEKVSSEQYYGNGALWTVLPTNGILYVRREGSEAAMVGRCHWCTHH